MISPTNRGGFSLDTTQQLRYNTDMNDDPCNTANIVANMMHDNALHIDSEGYDTTALLKMFVCVEATRGFDEEFMVELYDCLRNLAQETQDFENSLSESGVMSHEEIWGLCQ
jgi:hypothetical protein